MSLTAAPHRSADHPRGSDQLAWSGVAPSVAPAPETHGTSSSETTDLSAAEFADDIARQLGLPRITLSELLASQPLAEHFSRRFLRETMVFPFRSTQNKPCLAVADPRDTAAARAAGLVFGATIELVVASHEDIANALNRLAGDGDIPAREDAEPPQLRDDDIESLRDLATGAPV